MATIISEKNELLEVRDFEILYNNAIPALYTGTVDATLIKISPNLSLQGTGVIHRKYKNDETKLIKWIEGAFDKGLQHGKNCEINFSNGNLEYSGDVFYDKKEGNGKLYHFNGCLAFKGNFKNDLPHANNSYVIQDNGKFVYRGNRVNGELFGFGVCLYNNGQIKYIGEFERHQPKNGEVRVLRRNGQLGYDGHCKNGQTGDSRWYFLIK